MVVVTLSLPGTVVPRNLRPSGLESRGYIQAVRSGRSNDHIDVVYVREWLKARCRAQSVPRNLSVVPRQGPKAVGVMARRAEGGATGVTIILADKDKEEKERRHVA